MTKEKMNEAVIKFAEEAKRLYGAKLRAVILYGSWPAEILKQTAILIFWYCWMSHKKDSTLREIASWMQPIDLIWPMMLY